MRRGPLQHKVGAGLSPEEFHARVRDGSVRHVGLPESLHMLATSLGWTLDGADDLIMPVIADHEVVTEHVRVAPGQVAGVRQVTRGYVGEREVITLELEPSLAAGQVLMRLEDQELEIDMPRAVEALLSTIATCLNSPNRSRQWTT